MSSTKHLDRKRPAAKQSSKALGHLRLHTAEEVALWARRHSLLSVYLQATSSNGIFPACWQVVRPGYKTDSSAVGWMRGCKTFIYLSGKERAAAEQSARRWASLHFNVTEWVRIEGIGGALFPDVVGDALQTVDPEIIIARDRTIKTWKRS